MKKILLLGSGELGKEFVISAQRKGQYIIACDSYAGAPAMQVADECEVFSMLDGEALERVVRKPVDFIDGVINQHITELADISGEYYGDKAFKKILKDFDKLKIQKNGKK